MKIDNINNLINADKQHSSALPFSEWYLAKYGKKLPIYIESNEKKRLISEFEQDRKTKNK